MNRVLYKFQFKLGGFILYLVGGIFAIALSIYGFFFTEVNNSGELAKHNTTLFKYGAPVPFILAILSFVYLAVFVAEYLKIKKRLPLKDYKIVEGTVRNFFTNTMYRQESFDINGVEFEYSGRYLLNGYNQIKSSGGVITHEGQKLKIYYYPKKKRNMIVYIEAI